MISVVYNPDAALTASESDQSVEIACAAGFQDCQARQHIAQLNIEIKRLNQLVHTDNLTGLYNQRHLMKTLESEMERTRRTGRATGLIIMDLDHFKRVNDTFGHDVGNRVLQIAASCLERAVRKIDTPCRYGGEEFVIVLPNSDLNEAILVAERIRQAIEASPAETDAGVVPVTASLGVDVFYAHQSDAPESLIARADAFLYQAKQAGRNRLGHPANQKPAVVSNDEKEALFSLFGNTKN